MPSLNVLMILGHPRKDSFCAALFNACREGATAAGAHVETLRLADMDFDPNVHAESPEQQPLEPDLQHARELIEWADHLLFVYPTWWGSAPALLKGFLDRIVMPGFAFHFRDPDRLGWDRLWKGKTSQAITTMDTPPVLYRRYYGQPGTRALLRATLGFCGVRARRGLMLGPVRLSDAEQRRRWLIRAQRIGLAVQGGPGRRIVRRVSPWLLALRLQFYPMSWAAYTIGALAEAGTNAFASAAYWWGYICLFALEAATVFANDWFDYESDRHNASAGPFNGGSRMLVERRLDFRQLRLGIAAALTISLVSAVFAIQLAPRPGGIALMLAVMLVLTLGYTVPPLKLCHRSLGELDVGLTHGLIVLLFGYLLMGGTWLNPTPWLLALPISVAVLPAIILSGLPDRTADAEAGKISLPVRLGARKAAQLAMALTMVAAALALLVSRLAPVTNGFRGIAWGTIPHAGILVLMLWRLLHSDKPLADRRIDGVMLVALSYIVWFVAVPLWNLL